MKIKNKIKLFFLKRRARKIYYRLLDLQDNYGCGVQLIKFINPEFNRLDLELREIVLKIKEMTSQW